MTVIEKEFCVLIPNCRPSNLHTAAECLTDIDEINDTVKYKPENEVAEFNKYSQGHSVSPEVHEVSPISKPASFYVGSSEESVNSSFGTEV